MKSKLTFFEAISIIATISIAQIILDFPEYLIDNTGTGTIANLLFLSIITIIFCTIISNIFKNFSNQDIIDISELIGGRFLKFIISIIFIIFLELSAVLAFSSFIYPIKTLYFQNTHPLFVASIFIGAILIASNKGFFSTKKTATVFLGISVISVVALLFGDNGNYNTNNLIPFFGYDFRTTFQTGFSNIYIFNFVIMYFFLMPLLSRKNDYKKIMYSSLAINLSLIIIATISILLYYPTPIGKELSTLNSLNTIFLVTRRIQISSFLSQTDSIFVFFWSFVILNYIVLLVNGIVYILNKLFHYENKQKLSAPTISIIIGSVFFIDRIVQLEFLQKDIFKYFSIVLIFGISSIILILGFFKGRKKGFKNAKK